MKFGPCRKCLVAPLCTSMCEKKMNYSLRKSSQFRKKSVSKVTLEEFMSHLRATEGMTIRKIEVVDGTFKGAKNGS